MLPLELLRRRNSMAYRVPTRQRQFVPIPVALSGPYRQPIHGANSGLDRAQVMGRLCTGFP